MPRDSNGNTVPLPGTIVSTGDTVLPSQHNPMVNDVYAMMTQSLSRDGQGGMRANMNMHGFRILNVGNATQPTDAVSLAQLQNGTPVGAVLDYAGSNAPATWMFAYGQAISRTTYPALFAAIGTTYGAGNGTTTFNLPDCRGRVVAGKDDMGGVDAGRLTFFGAVAKAIGGIFGSASHVLTAGQMANHKHSGVKDKVAIPTDGWGTDGGALGRVDRGRIVVGSGSWEAGGETLESLNSSSKTSRTINLSGSVDTSEQGNDEAHTNAQPTIIMNKIIKVSY